VLSCLCRYTYLGECPVWPSYSSHINQLLSMYDNNSQRILDFVNPVPRPASLLVNSKGRPFTNVSEAVVRLHKKCGFTVAFTNRMHVGLMRHGHRTFHRRTI
jgi:hypothetical protein